MGTARPAGVITLDVLPGLIVGVVAMLLLVVYHAIAFADTREPVIEVARRSGLLEDVGEDHIFHTISAAAVALVPEHEEVP
jgi:hypothetical protein